MTFPGRQSSHKPVQGLWRRGRRHRAEAEAQWGQSHRWPAGRGQAWCRSGCTRMRERSKDQRLVTGQSRYQGWYRGILVKLVICVSSGQLKIKIANLMQYAILAYFLPFSNTLSLENMIGNLIAPLTKLLYHIIGNSMSRGDLQNIMQWVWQDKSICLPQMNCQRLHIDGKKYSRNQSCHFFKNLQHVTFVHTDTIAAFISSGQSSENLFFHFKW